MKSWRRRWFRWAVPAFAALMVAAPASAYPVLEDTRAVFGVEQPVLSSERTIEPSLPQAPLLASEVKLAPDSAPVVSAPQATTTDGFGWGDAGVGAAGLAAMLLLAGAGAMFIRRGRGTQLAGA